MGQIVRYTATDGAELELTPRVVLEQLVSPKDRQQLSDRGVAMVIATCASLRMNPLAGDCHIGVFKGRPTVMPSIGYYERVAAQQETYDGMESGVVFEDQEGRLRKAQGCIVPTGCKLVGGWACAYDTRRTHSTSVEVALGEYDQQNAMWEAKPATMIRKVAKAQALRELYPGNFAGTYTTDELTDERGSADEPVEPEIEIPDFEDADDDEQEEQEIEG